MAITRRQKVAKVAAAKKRLKLPDLFRNYAKRPLPGGLARGVRPISHNKRGKKSYKAGNILKEISIGKTDWVGAKVKMPYRQYRAVTSGPTGQIAYGPKGNRKERNSTTRLVSRRCESKNECKDWAGKYGGKMTYIKYRKKKFYKNNAALDTRKTYNKAEPNGRGFIQSYRQARANYQKAQNGQNSPTRQRQMRLARRSAAKNAAATRLSMRTRGSSPTKPTKKRRLNVDPSAIVYGKRKRMKTVR